MYAWLRSSTSGGFALDLEGRVDPGHQSLGGGFLVAGRAVDLPGEVEPRDRLGFQRRQELRRRGVIVFDRIAPAQDLRVLQARECAAASACCTSLGRLVLMPLQ